MFAGVGAAIALATALLLSRGSEPAPTVAMSQPAETAAAGATNAASPEPPAGVPSASPPPFERVDGKATSSVRARPSAKASEGARSAPRRPAKPAKPAAVARAAEDFGI